MTAFRHSGFNRTWLSGGLLTLVVMATSWGCGTNQYRTLRPTLGRDSVNTLFPDESPSLSGDGRYVVFSSSREGTQNIYMYDLQQQRMVQLPGVNSDEYSASEPAISGDGRFIVYVSNSLGKSEIFLFDRQTRRILNISNRRPGDVRNPSISADGRYIVFESNGAGQWDIELFDRQAGTPQQTTPPQQQQQP